MFSEKSGVKIVMRDCALSMLGFMKPPWVRSRLTGRVQSHVEYMLKKMNRSSLWDMVGCCCLTTKKILAHRIEKLTPPKKHSVCP